MAPKKPKAGKAFKVKATVKLGDGSKATGTVTFAIDGKKVKKTVSLKNGKAVLKVGKKKSAKLGKGKHKVVVRYAGFDTALKSSAKVKFKLR